MALCTALALFHAVWGDMERLVNENENDEKGGNEKTNGISSKSFNNDNHDNSNTNNDNNDNNNNLIKNPRKETSLSLSHYFGIALERSFPELSDLEMFQVCELFF